MDYQEKLKEGITLKNQERYEEAADRFGEAIALNDKQPEAFFYRANILNHSLKKYPEALADYNQAILLEIDI